jgi:hypothetical protein
MRPGYIREKRIPSSSGRLDRRYFVVCTFRKPDFMNPDPDTIYPEREEGVEVEAVEEQR